MARRFGRKLPPMPAGGYDLTDAIPALVEARARHAGPKRTGKLKEFVQGDGGDDRMHAVLLGKDDQFTTIIKAVPAKTRH